MKAEPKLIKPERYREEMLALLSKRGGVMPMATVEAELKRKFGRHFNQADRSLWRNGRTRWQSMTDWAKAVATSKDQSQIVTVDGVKYLVLMNIMITPYFWYVKAMTKKVARSAFNRKCKRCGHKNPLSWQSCLKCGEAFPKKYGRRDVKVEV